MTDEFRTIAVGCDHGGYDLKQLIVELLVELDCKVVDVGCNSTSSVDYPSFGNTVCDKINQGQCSAGILICGTGIGMSMVANRKIGIRAALCHDEYTARLSREHNDANVLCLGARVLGSGVAREIVREWLTTDFAGGRHQQRISQFSD